MAGLESLIRVITRMGFDVALLDELTSIEAKENGVHVRTTESALRKRTDRRAACPQEARVQSFGPVLPLTCLHLSSTWSPVREAAIGWGL